MFSAAWKELSKGRPLAEVGEEYQRRRDEALAQQADADGFPPVLGALVRALADRDKMIIDADKVPGRRSLWLVPLGPFGFPMPGTMPAPRSRRHPNPQRTVGERRGVSPPVVFVPAG